MHGIPPDERKSLSSPVLAGQVWDDAAVVPTMRVEENVAEKLSLWQSSQLVRDLYDMAEIAPSVNDLSLVAKMYVLKSHKNYVATLPSSRPARAEIDFWRRWRLQFNLRTSSWPIWSNHRCLLTATRPRPSATP